MASTRIQIAATMIIAPSNPAEKKVMRSYPYRNVGRAGFVLKRRLNAADATAITCTTDSAKSDRMAADPVMKYAVVLPANISTPTASDMRMANRAARSCSWSREAAGTTGNGGESESGMEASIVG